MRTANILVVEDDVPTAKAICRILESTRNHTVVPALDGAYALPVLDLEIPPELEEAVAAWNFGKRKPAKFDLVIVDCLMPIMDGLTLVTLMHGDERTRRLPVIVLTNKSKMEEPFRQAPNVVDFITKPVVESVLLDAVRKALAPKT